MLFDVIDGAASSAIAVYEEEEDVLDVNYELKKPWVLAHRGICVAALRGVPEMATPLVVC